MFHQHTSSYKTIRNALRDSLPTNGVVMGTGSDADRLVLYKAGTQGFIKTQLAVNTATFAAVEFLFTGKIKLVI